MTLSLETAYFKEEPFFEELVIPTHKPAISKIVDIILIPEVLDYELIHTEEGLSYEGQRLTGLQLLVSLKLQEKLTYIAQTPDQTIHGVHYTQFKSSFIVLPIEINQRSTQLLVQTNQIKVKPSVQSLYTQIKSPHLVLNYGLLSVHVSSC